MIPFPTMGSKTNKLLRVQAERLFLGCWTDPKSPWVVLASGMRILALFAYVRFRWPIRWNAIAKHVWYPLESAIDRFQWSFAVLI